MGCGESAVDEPSPSKSNHSHPPEPKAKKTSNINPNEISISDATNKTPDIRIVFIGPSDCGKSTLWRQLESSYSSSHHNDDKHEYIDSNKINLVKGTKTLIDTAMSKGKNFSNDMKAIIDHINQLSLNPKILSPQSADKIIRVWNHPNIQEIYKQIQYTDMDDNFEYLINNINRITQPNYSPTDEDIINSFTPTKKISSMKFCLNDTITAELFDVSGSKLYRNQWENLMGADYFVFVASLSDFGMFLREDKNVQRTADSFELFEKVANSEKPIFLVLNKTDIFETKLNKLTEKFRETYKSFNDDTNNVDECIEHVKQCYLSRVDPGRDFQKAWIEPIESCAIDKKSVTQLFQKVAKKILKIPGEPTNNSPRKPPSASQTPKQQPSKPPTSPQQQPSPKPSNTPNTPSQQQPSKPPTSPQQPPSKPSNTPNTPNQQKPSNTPNTPSQQPPPKPSQPSSSQTNKPSQTSNQDSNDRKYPHKEKKVEAERKSFPGECCVYEYASEYVTDVESYSEFVSSS